MDQAKKQIITIGGRPGSGKSTTAKGLAQHLGFMHFSSGDLFRALSKKQGHNVLESNLAAEKVEGVSPIDALVDQKLRDLGSSEDQLIIDSRMAWHWMPYSFKVFLDLDFETAAQRILGSMSPDRLEAEHIPGDHSEYAQLLRDRLASESRRYKKVYNADPYIYDNYDLIVDTKQNSPEQVLQIILQDYDEWSTR